MLRVLHLSGVLVLLLLVPVQAQIYKWIDRDGRVHFTDTIAGIPPEYRSRIEEKTSAAPALPFVPERSALTPTATPSAASPSAVPTPTSYTVPLRRDGNAMLVEAVVAGNVRTLLLLDTGAEFTVLSTAAARRLSLDLHNTALIPLRSASGVFLAPLTKVPSIAVGEATVYDVEVVVHDATPGLGGLLGMSFLDHFSMTISGGDPRLILTPLTENAEIELYGGHPQDWWRRKFRFYRGQIDSVKRYMGVQYTPELERTLRYFRTELETLDRQASRAGVPRRWRD